MGNTLRRNVVKPFYNVDLHQNQHKNLSESVYYTTKLKSNHSCKSLSGRSTNSDGSFSKKSFYQSFPAMFSGSKKKSKKAKKLVEVQSEEIFSENLTQFEQTKNNINSEIFCDNDKQCIDEETENDLNIEKKSNDYNNFSNENKSPTEKTKSKSATETSTFRVPDISVKQRFDRLKSSRPVLNMCSFNAPKSLTDSTLSLGGTENNFKLSNSSEKFDSLTRHQSFNNNYECNGFFINN